MLAVAGEHQPRPLLGTAAGAPSGGSIEEPQSQPQYDGQELNRRTTRRSEGGEGAGAGAGGGGGGSSSFLCSLVWAASTLAGWRARRKESDKASSIQQHLRAIRHAENLDRQTHFRRSQVQRLVQRFDSTGTQFIEQLQQHRTSGAKLSPLQPPTGGALDSAIGCCWPRGEDAERLLAVLAQLIGGQNVWRLADTLRRHWAAQQQTSGELILVAPAPPPSPRAQAQVQQQQQPVRRQQLLDLCKLSDRKLALALLEFLAELARKAISEIQIGRGSLVEAEAEQPARAAAAILLEDSTTTSAKQSLVSSPVVAASAKTEAEDDSDCSPRLEIVHPDDLTRREAGRQQLCKIGQQPTTTTNCKAATATVRLSKRHWSQKEAHKQKHHQAAAVAAEDKPPVVGDNSQSTSRQLADNQEIMSAPFVGVVDGRQRQPPQSQMVHRDETTTATSATMTSPLDNDDDDDEADPIKRTLECIMGTKGSGVCPAPRKQPLSIRTQREQQQQRRRQMNGLLVICRTTATTNDNPDWAGGHSGRDRAAEVSETAVNSRRDNNFHSGQADHCQPDPSDVSPGLSGEQLEFLTRPEAANELPTASSQTNGRQEANETGGQVIGQSINGDASVAAVVATNHRNPGGEIRVETRACRVCCCECAPRRPPSRGRCCTKSPAGPSPGHDHQQPVGNSTGSSEPGFCCCPRSGCNRAGRRRHRTRSGSGGSRSGTSKGDQQRAPQSSHSASRQRYPRAHSSPPTPLDPATTATARYLKNINQQQVDNGDNCEQDCELVEDKL